MITIVENFISKQECKKFIKMVSHLKLPDDADFENEYKPYWEYRLKDITNNSIVGKVSNYFKKHLNHNLIINQAQIQVWIPGSYSILHTHDEDGRGRKDTYWNSLIYLNDVDDGGTMKKITPDNLGITSGSASKGFAVAMAIAL